MDCSVYQVIQSSLRTTYLVWAVWSPSVRFHRESYEPLFMLVSHYDYHLVGRVSPKNTIRVCFCLSILSTSGRVCDSFLAYGLIVRLSAKGYHNFEMQQKHGIKRG